jgi:F0F1-type ATP synthase membrane subunit b/b'
MLDSFSKTQITMFIAFLVAAGILSFVLYKAFGKVHAENFNDYEDTENDDDKYIY